MDRSVSLVRGVTEVRVLVGIGLLIGAAASFALKVLLFGFVVLAALVLAIAGVVCVMRPRSRQVGRGLLVGAAVLSVGPLVYVGLAFL